LPVGEAPGGNVEAPCWIAVNGTRRIVLSCSPHEIGALAVGHLLAEAWIERAGDLHAWREVAGGVEVSMDAARIDAANALREHQVAKGCGLRHFLDCDVASLPRVSMKQPPRDPAALLRSLFQHASEGGVHAAAWSDGETLVHVTTDVARHCAVDRVIGLAALAGAHHGGLVVSARVSGAMAVKAARAGIGWIASRSIATTLAQELCAAAGITLYERAARAHG
jgi:FdhD protein